MYVPAAGFVKPAIVCRTGLTAPIWARYNSPMTPWFLCRNEIMIPLTNEAESSAVDHEKEADES